jgi:hypothetical protein
MLTLQIYHLLAFSIRCSIEKVLPIRKDSGEGFADKSGDGSETDVGGWGAELAWDAEVRLSAEAGYPLSGGFRIPIAYTDKKLQNRRIH